MGVERGIFDLLADTGSTLQTAEVAEKTEVEPVLARTVCLAHCYVAYLSCSLLRRDLRRLLQYYQSVGMIEQPGDGVYTANNVTKALAAPVGHSGIKFL